jgi:hypothetical protein
MDRGGYRVGSTAKKSPAGLGTFGRAGGCVPEGGFRIWAGAADVSSMRGRSAMDQKDRMAPATAIAGELAPELSGVGMGEIVLDRRIQEAIGRSLRAHYDDLVNAPVPDRFLVLLAELEAMEQRHGG